MEEGNEEKVEDYDKKNTMKEVVDEGMGVEDYDNKDPMKEGVEVVEEGKELEKGKVVEEEEEGKEEKWNNLPMYDEKNIGKDDGLDPILRQNEERDVMNEIKENQVN